VRALVESRLAALSPEARALTGLAAVIGRQVDADLLLSIAERHLLSRALSERDWAKLLSELATRHVLVEARGGTLAFSHETLRRTAYERVREEERWRLHGRVAAALETLEPPTPNGELVSELAHHHERARNYRRAIDFLEQAGELALARSAHADAAATFLQALSLVEEHGPEVSDQRLARFHALAGAALQGLGQLTESKRHLRAAVALLGWAAGSSPWATGLQIAWQTLRQVMHRTFGVGTVQAARRAELVSAARAYDHLLQVHYFEADRLSLLHAMLMTLNLAERAGPSPELASAYGNTFAALSLAPPLRGLAESYLTRAKLALGHDPDPAVESYLALLHGVELASLGNWAEAEPCVRTAVDIAERLGFRRRWEEGMAILAHNHALRGDEERALAEAGAVERSALRGDPQTRCWSLVILAQAKLALGSAREACEALTVAGRLAEGLGRDERIWVGGILAAAELERDAVKGAELAAETTLSLIGNELPMVSVAGEAYAAVADVLLELCRRDEGRERSRLGRAEKACAALERVARAFPFMEPRALLCRGDLARLLGRERRAVAAFTRSAEVARRCQLDGVLKRAEKRLA
jgi:tetratricopeptide (TPR) repeat protein